MSPSLNQDLTFCGQLSLLRDINAIQHVKSMSKTLEAGLDMTLPSESS